MSGNWRSSLIERLLGAAEPGGGWAYNAASPASTEPTCLALLAMAAHDLREPAWDKGPAWLAETQRQDGGVPVSREVTGPCWPTALAVLAFLASSKSTGDALPSNAERACAWLLNTRGLTLESDPSIYGHNTQLIGWPWVDGTHTWLEPTAYAILALRAAGRGDHPRVREGIELIFDRSIPGGGWNYGNPRMFGSDLRPFPGTTGIVLAALAGEPHDSRISDGIDYLTAELTRLRAPMSLGWGLIGLRAWNRQPADSEGWLGEAAGRAMRGLANPLEDALLLIAGAEVCPIVTESPEVSMTSAVHSYG